MKILLVVPRNFLNLREPTHFPVGMALISSALKKAGNRVFVLNLNFTDEPLSLLLKTYIRDKNIEIVMTGGLVTDYHAIDRIISAVKLINQELLVCIGGGLVTCAPEVVMQGMQNSDFAVYGEGEITCCELVKALENRSDLESIDGLLFRRNGEIIKNKPREEIQNLDDYPWPDYEGFELSKMLDTAPKRYITMSTGRSCAFHCTFCFHTAGKKYRQRSLDSFFAELDYLVENYQIDNLYITDELFAINRKRLEDFCARIVKYDILWAVQLRVEVARRDLLQLLKKSGCIIISFGLESADDSVLKSMRKNITIEQIESALQNCLEVGIQANGSFIFGDIVEDIHTVEKTMSWWNKHRQYNISLALIQVYPGTHLYQYALEKGIIRDELEFIKSGCPYVNLSKLTDVQYRKLGVSIYKNIAHDLEYPLEATVDSLNYKKSRLDIKGTCVNCGAENCFHEVYMTLPVNRICRVCGYTHTINPYVLRKEVLNQCVEKLLQKHKQIAFYGVGKVLKNIFDLVPALNQENSIIIDDKNILQGAMFEGRRIYSPAILRDKEIYAVVICDYIIAMLLDTRLRDLYPFVSERVSCFDLLGFNEKK